MTKPDKLAINNWLKRLLCWHSFREGNLMRSCEKCGLTQVWGFNANMLPGWTRHE